MKTLLLGFLLACMVGLGVAAAPVAAQPSTPAAKVGDAEPGRGRGSPVLPALIALLIVLIVLLIVCFPSPRRTEDEDE